MVYLSSHETEATRQLRRKTGKLICAWQTCARDQAVDGAGLGALQLFALFVGPRHCGQAVPGKHEYLHQRTMFSMKAGAYALP